MRQDVATVRLSPEKGHRVPRRGVFGTPTLADSACPAPLPAVVEVTAGWVGLLRSQALVQWEG